MIGSNESLNFTVLTIAARILLNRFCCRNDVQNRVRREFMRFLNYPTNSSKDSSCTSSQELSARALREKWTSFHFCRVLQNDRGTEWLINPTIICSIIVNSLCTNSFKKNALSCRLVKTPWLHTFWMFSTRFDLISNCGPCRHFQGV